MFGLKRTTVISLKLVDCRFKGCSNKKRSLYLFICIMSPSAFM